jgi:hypothetical protein
MYYEHKKEATAKQLEALNLEAANQEVKNSVPLDSSSVQKHHNGTVITNGIVDGESNGRVAMGGVENKAYVIDNGV